LNQGSIWKFGEDELDKIGNNLYIMTDKNTIKAIDLVKGIEKLLDSKVVVGYEGTRLYGHFTMFFNNGVKVHIEVKETFK
jgi:hypothetical protein